MDPIAYKNHQLFCYVEIFLWMTFQLWLAFIFSVSYFACKNAHVLINYGNIYYHSLSLCNNDNIYKHSEFMLQGLKYAKFTNSIRLLSLKKKKF